MSEQNSRKQKKKLEKCFNDPVHGHIVLHPLLVNVIDTPQFQRLRQLKQLGGCYYVYPGATHNRFEHSLGTCHLAGKLMRHIAKQEDWAEKGLEPTAEDILCVELAGLCHDLGHGPYSHVFDTRFMENVGKKWAHEQGSRDMLDHLIKDEKNNMRRLFEEYGLDVDKDVPFIQQLIDPRDDFTDLRDKRAKKTYLFEIISNKINSVDVDKWDYFARDCHHVGIQNSFDHNRFMAFIKVLKDERDDAYHLCVKDKEAKNLYEMFHTRDALHRRAYKHKVTKAVEEMICDAMVLADKHIKFKGKNGNILNISECIRDMQAYQQLNDSVIDLILQSDSDHKDMKEAKLILQRLMRRHLYKLVGLKRISCTEVGLSKLKLVMERFDDMAKTKNIDKTNYFVTKLKFDYAMKEDNPVSKFWFYTKDEPEKAITLKKQDVSYMLPEIFLEYEVVIYSKSNEKTVKEKLKEVFDDWVKEVSQEET